MGQDEGTTFAEDIEEAAAGEPIDAVVIGTRGDHWLDEEPQEPQAVLSWNEARPRLNYEYDDGYGGADCHAIYAWTPSRVLFVHEYDGSTTVTSVPRNPEAGKPIFP